MQVEVQKVMMEDGRREKKLMMDIEKMKDLNKKQSMARVSHTSNHIHWVGEVGIERGHKGRVWE